jgi:hypothetical protein
VRLFSDDRVTTVHPSSGDLPGSEKTWFLDRTCSLQPEYVQELVAEKRTVRPPGQWTVTAKLHTVVSSQAQEPIDLVGGRCCHVLQSLMLSGRTAPLSWHTRSRTPVLVYGA